MQIILFVGDRQFDGAKRWQVSHCPVDIQGRVQKFLINRLVDFSIKWVDGVPRFH